jgi:SagB-type dehydrogenase family enzyme
MEDNRAFLKSDWWTRFDEFRTDQQNRLPRPDVQKSTEPNAVRIDLIPPDQFTIGDVPLTTLVKNRRSQRHFADTPLSLEELSFLLWATQGITQVIGDAGINYYKRAVPSGGNRHPFETYLSIHTVTGLEIGLYRYLPLDHQLVVERLDPDLPAAISAGGLSQTSQVNGKSFPFIEKSAVTFVWTAIPYRTEWRYGPPAAKLIAVDAGHMCQNLYLACGAIGAGTVAVGAFDRIKTDAVLNVDGEEEFSIYMAPVGKLAAG